MTLYQPIEMGQISNLSLLLRSSSSFRLLRSSPMTPHDMVISGVLEHTDGFDMSHLAKRWRLRGLEPCLFLSPFSVGSLDEFELCN